MERSDSITELAKALVKVQAELEPVRREHTAKIPTKSGGSYSYTYASLEDVFACSRRILTHFGLAVTQLPCETSSGGDGLRTILLHESGEFISDVLPLRGQDATMQALGAAITYARRYGYQSAVGIAAEEDDDAAPAGRTQTATQGAQAPPAKRSTDEEGEEESRGDCPVHGVPFVHKVGVSRPKEGQTEGKPYDFWGCDAKNEDGSWCKEKPLKVAAPDPEDESVLDSEPPNPGAVTVMDILRANGKEAKGQQIAALGKACLKLEIGLPQGSDPEAWLSGLDDETLGRLCEAVA